MPHEQRAHARAHTHTYIYEHPVGGIKQLSFSSCKALLTNWALRYPIVQNVNKRNDKYALIPSVMFSRRHGVGVWHQPNEKLSVFRSSLGATRMSNHTEELWYNETVCLWMTIYIYIYIYIYISIQKIASLFVRANCFVYDYISN